MKQGLTTPTPTALYHSAQDCRPQEAILGQSARFPSTLKRLYQKKRAPLSLAKRRQRAKTRDTFFGPRECKEETRVKSEDLLGF
jgi:hypothetical protein